MKSPFQTILLIVCGIVFAGAVLVFSGLISFGSKTTNTTTPTGTVVMWGTVPQKMMRTFLDAAGIGNGDYLISYTEHSPDTLKQDLIVALASGSSPDILLYPSEMLTQVKDMLYVIPYAAYPERTFRDTNIDGAQLFLTKDGSLGFPLVVDPLVVYYNKDLLAKANFIIPPQTWTDLKTAVPLLTTKDVRNKLLQSAIGLGSANNVSHIEDILSAMFLQTGNSIIAYDAVRDRTDVVVGVVPAGGTTAPTAQALDFYTSFSNPTNSNYSWNSALPTSLAQFLAGKSVFYIGRASELFTIQAQNPNLNFDVMELFQTGANTRTVTFGSFLAVDMLKKAPNPVAAYAAASAFALPANVDALSKVVSLPPVQRSLLLSQQANPYVSVFFKAALSAFGWLDTDPAQTETVFKNMVTAVTSGKSDAATAIYEAGRELQ
jgi:ABC-type glycerol-3-phosphate transport system substrate-binding protein